MFDSKKVDIRNDLFLKNMKFLQKAVIFHLKNDTFVTLKRDKKAYSRPGKWDLPGGNVKFGEAHDASLKREIKEETGLDTDKPKPIIVQTNYVCGIYYLFIGYKTKAQSDKVILSKEHTEYKWISREEFLGLESADFLQNLVYKL